MAPDRRGSQDEAARAEESERAVELFAGLIERADDPLHPDRAHFDELVRRHPELRAELLRIWDGMVKFESIRGRLPQLQVARRSNRWRWVAGGIAAAGVVALAAWWLDRGAAPAPNRGATPMAARPAPETDAEVAALRDQLLDAGLVCLEQSFEQLKYHDPVPPAPAEGDGAKSNDPPRPAPDVDAAVVARGERTVAEIVNVCAAVSQLEDLSRDGAAGGSTSRLDAVRMKVETIAPNFWRPRLRQAFENPEKGSISDAAPLLLALTRDPKLQATLLSKQQQGALPQMIADLAEAAASPARISLKAIDLDQGGAEITGATVYVQSVDPVTGIFGPAAVLDSTPVDGAELVAGDWRITVVEPQHPRGRHSELRLLAMPGEDLGTRVAFFRAIPDLSTSMVHLPAASFHFGTPPSVQHPIASNLPFRTESLPDFWIDRDEVTCQEYSDFYLEAQARPDWFGGIVPIHRPRILDLDGTCPPRIARFPIVEVTWEEAVVYANWAGKRLPTEREWERAARGTVDDDRVYPWGNVFAPPGKHCVNESGSIAFLVKRPSTTNPPDRIQINVPLAVTFVRLSGCDVDDPSYADGSTPGVAGAQIRRMADNAAEFVEDLYVEMRGSVPSLLQTKSVARVYKGASWLNVDENTSTNWSRAALFPDARMATNGLRCVKTTAPGFGPK